MPKEYRTIQEVAGPLMLIKDTSGVTYNELGEIELANGERRRCKVLEVNGSDALVQLFENSAGINLSDSKVRFLGHGIELYTVLLYMPDYMNSSAGIEQLMPWSDFIKEKCSGLINVESNVPENRIPLPLR